MSITRNTSGTLEQYAAHFPDAHQCGHKLVNGQGFSEWANGQAPGTPWSTAYFCDVCHAYTPCPDTVGCPDCSGEEGPTAHAHPAWGTQA